MTGWRVSLVALGFIALTVVLMRSCGLTEPLVIPDWADSVRAVRDSAARERRFWRDSVARERAVADSAQRAADSWRQRALVRPTRPPRPGTTVPDSGSPDTNPDIVSGYRAQIDSLWAALDASDSAYASLDRAFAAQRQATAAALAGWAAADSALTKQGLVAQRAINSLTVALNKARRGCRVLWVISCPEITGGYGAVLSDGQVHHGPGVQVGFKIKFGGS